MFIPPAGRVRAREDLLQKARLLARRVKRHPPNYVVHPLGSLAHFGSTFIARSPVLDELVDSFRAPPKFVLFRLFATLCDIIRGRTERITVSRHGVIKFAVKPPTSVKRAKEPDPLRARPSITDRGFGQI